MIPAQKSACFGFCLLLCGSLSADPKNTPFIEETVQKYKQELPSLRLQEDDFKLYQGWDVNSSLTSIENLFAHPLELPPLANSWVTQVENSPRLLNLFQLSEEILGQQRTSTRSPSSANIDLQSVVNHLAEAINQAQPHLDKAVNSVKPEQRKNFLSLYESLGDFQGKIKQEISNKKIKEKYDGMKTFQLPELLEAGEILTNEIDTVLIDLERIKPTVSTRTTFNTSAGKMIVSGAGDDTYSADDLKDVTVLIDLGGTNVYNGPAAAAAEKKIRLVFDLGNNVTVQSDLESQGNAASGIFGIGIMVLPHSSGVKKFSNGSFSQGCGIGGIGMLIVRGETHLDAEHYAQGCGIFGVGILQVKDGKNSRFSATRQAQGFAMTQGVGLFSHQGDDTLIKGGLVDPDPREPLGSQSLCQGVGFGPRAFAGGGVGLAALIGDRISVYGSYFSQGVGYWHSLGIFSLKGNQNRLQARRYDQGSGVHFGFGHFQLEGDHNQVINWGVGPAYGWDRSVGSALIKGNHNVLQGEWGTATASIGSFSFSRISGNENTMKLPQFGHGQFFRNEFSYSLHLIDGKKNKMLDLTPSPWGHVRFEDVTFSSAIALPAPEWPTPATEKAKKHEMVNLSAILERGGQKTAPAKVEDWLNVASAFSMDKETPRLALTKLISLPPKEIPYLLDALDPDHVESLIQLQVILASHGKEAAQAIRSGWKKFPLKKQVMLLNMLGFYSPQDNIPFLFETGSTSKASKVRNTCILVLGQLFNRDNGDEPGRRKSLEMLQQALQNPSGPKQEEVLELLTHLPSSDIFGLIMTAYPFSTDEKLQLLKVSPEDITANINRDAAKTMVSLINTHKEEAALRIQKELDFLTNQEGKTRNTIDEIFKSTEIPSIRVGLIALGEIGNAQDAPRIASYLTHEKSNIRETAAVALSRLGEAGLPILEQAFDHGSTQTRSLVMVSVANAITPQASLLLKKGLTDPEPNVRIETLTTIRNLPSSLSPQQEKLIQEAKSKLKGESNREVLMLMKGLGK